MLVAASVSLVDIEQPLSFDGVGTTRIEVGVNAAEEAQQDLGQTSVALPMPPSPPSPLLNCSPLRCRHRGRDWWWCRWLDPNPSASAFAWLGPTPQIRCCHGWLGRKKRAHIKGTEGRSRRGHIMGNAGSSRKI
ncbi:Os09g0403633 [Oryza sativa Japonica Group]|uniref:Os09g0403633 protein n=1 Tax=Oryza sativa subsp. japonica TaxID=39947 RepID=A0A0P0XLF0_ORYSJ|nr:Os09g0403633 [Oryza sativa Japonica Group]